MKRRLVVVMAALALAGCGSTKAPAVPPPDTGTIPPVIGTAGGGLTPPPPITEDTHG